MVVKSRQNVTCSIVNYIFAKNTFKITNYKEIYDTLDSYVFRIKNNKEISFQAINEIPEAIGSLLVCQRRANAIK